MTGNVRLRSFFVDPMHCLKTERINVMFLVPTKEIGEKIIVRALKEMKLASRKMLVINQKESILTKTPKEEEFNLEVSVANKMRRSGELFLLINELRPELIIQPNVTREDYVHNCYSSNSHETISSAVEVDLEGFMAACAAPEGERKGPNICFYIKRFVQVDEQGEIKKIYQTDHRTETVTVIYERD